MSDEFDQFRSLICQKDSTSKFVALFLLLRIVDRDREAAATCWQYIEPGFLDGLLSAGKSVSEEEAKDLRALGCSILYAFASIDSIISTRSFLRRSEALMKLYVSRKSLEEDVAQKVEQVLQVIASQKEGAGSLISSKHYARFVDKVLQEQSEHGLSVLRIVLVETLSTSNLAVELFGEQLSRTINSIARSLESSSESLKQGIDLLSRFLPGIPLESFDTCVIPTAATSITKAIRSSLCRPTDSAMLGTILILLAAMLRARDLEALLEGDQDQQRQSKYLVLVCALASTELRSSLAPLAEGAHGSDDNEASLRVASCFDILRMICLYLITTKVLPLKPDDIIGIRDNCAAAFGETIAYLRDRWDRSPFCPTSAYHVGIDAVPSLRDRELPVDPTIMSGTQSLCLWIQEDESLHSEACGIIDVLVGLLRECKGFEVDYGIWTLPALEALLNSDKGKEECVRFGLFDVVQSRLEALGRQLVGDSTAKLDTRVLQDANNDLAVMSATDSMRANAWITSNFSLVGRIEMFK